MTPSQKRVIAALREALLRRETLGGRQEVEVKREEVELMEWGEVSMVIEVGGVGDEETMAEVFCRDRRHVFIGRRGGVRLLNAKDGKKRRGFFAAVNTVTR